MDYSILKAMGATVESTAGFVLCGGHSLRMGRDKAMLPFDGQPLVSYMAKLVETAAGSATLVGAPERYRHLGYPVLADGQANSGPLAGLVTLLTATQADLNLVVPVDMPNLELGFVSSLLAAARLATGADVVVPSTTSGTHPLSAVYRRTALEGLASDLRAGQLRVRDALKRLKIKEIRVEPEALANLNTPDDWVRFVKAG